MPLDDMDMKDDTKFQALRTATNEMWTMFPDRREEWMRPWLNTEKGEVTRKSLMLGLLNDADWQKDLSPDQRKKLEILISDEIAIDRTPLIPTLCEIALKNKLQSAIPALKKASASRKEGSANRKVIDGTLKELSALE